MVFGIPFSFAILLASIIRNKDKQLNDFKKMYFIKYYRQIQKEKNNDNARIIQRFIKDKLRKYLDKKKLIKNGTDKLALIFKKITDVEEEYCILRFYFAYKLRLKATNNRIQNQAIRLFKNNFLYESSTSNEFKGEDEEEDKDNININQDVESNNDNQETDQEGQVHCNH